MERDDDGRVVMHTRKDCKLLVGEIGNCLKVLKLVFVVVMAEMLKGPLQVCLDAAKGVDGLLLWWVRLEAVSIRLTLLRGELTGPKLTVSAVAIMYVCYCYDVFIKASVYYSSISS